VEVFMTDNARQKQLKLGILSSHPIQYQVPLFRELAARSGVDLMVYFCHNHGVEATYDEGFGKVVKFDVPLLEGYRYEFLRNIARRPSAKFAGMVNPDIVRIIASGRLDALVIHGYSSPTTLLALATPRRRTKLLLRGDSNVLSPRPALTSWAKQLAMPAIFSRVDQFLSIGTLNTEYYQSYGVRAERITLAPFSVDNAFFESRARPIRSDKSAARRAAGFPETGVLFGFVAKLLQRKRPADLLQAFSQVHQLAPCSLAFVGDGELLESLRNETMRLGLSEKVVFTGFANQSALPALYAAFDVFVLPSQVEPWGLVVNEALASGAGVVTSMETGASRDLVEPDATFPAGDVNKLARIMARLLQNPRELASLKRRGNQRISGWGIPETADGFIEGARRAIASG
jgi:glycosyltransferase involved in cell wall biosynthesis